MLLIHSTDTDVYFNLAAEDYLLHEMDEDILMFWQSRKAVVCGKHQNLCAEVNYGYCRNNDIDVARRLSGGGTVFQDAGNVNFTFIKTIPEGLQYAVDYRRFLEPIRGALQSIGIETTYSKRNDLLFEGKKISGNAEHVLQKKKRVLHHGTLLFNTDLNSLGKALKPDGKYTDRAVKSVRSEVTNLCHARPDLETPVFIDALLKYFIKSKHTNWYVLNSEDVQKIKVIADTKYASVDWKIGYSPSYKLTRQITDTNQKVYTLDMHCVKGMIDSIHIADHNGQPIFDHCTQAFAGKPLNEEISTAFVNAIYACGFSLPQFALF